MKYKKWIVVSLVLLSCLILVGNALTANGYLISRSVIAGGGQQASGDDFVLNGTIAEPIASDLSIGTTYGLRSGFWLNSNFQIYLPLVFGD